MNDRPGIEITTIQQLLDVLKDLPDATPVSSFDRDSGKGRENPYRHPLRQLVKDHPAFHGEPMFSYCGVGSHDPSATRKPKDPLTIHTVGELRARLAEFGTSVRLAGFKPGPEFCNFYTPAWWIAEDGCLILE